MVPKAPSKDEDILDGSDASDDAAEDAERPTGEDFGTAKTESRKTV
ncbi:MAG: hypothetical protein QG650_1190 [Patescibacteria group bacterium]|jgi:hypothetical protein|nr:hypothetical protein [Patescibacteria group bacterium]